MAKVVFGDITTQGKVGNKVYSRNKSGFYVKTFKAPTDARTSAQLSARARLLNAAGAFASKSDTDKLAWNTFGANYFVGRSGVHKGTSSGYNAFISLFSTAQNAIAFSRLRTFKIGITSLTDTPVDFILPTTAPIGAVSGVIEADDGSPIPLFLKSGTLLAATGECSVLVGMNSEQSAAPKFVDYNTGEAVGFAIQISPGRPHPTGFINNPNNQVIAFIKQPTVLTTWTPTDEFSINVNTADLDISRFKKWVTPNQYVQMSLYEISLTGQQMKLGSVILKVS